MIDFFSHFFRPGSLVFDIGANHGLWTKALLEACAGRVVAVEMQPTLADEIRLRYARDGRVTVVCKAVGEADGLAQPYICQFDTVASLNPDWQTGRFKGLEWHPAGAVGTISLDHLIQDYGRPSLIKLDIEGWERQALAGLSKPIHSFIFEFVREGLENTLACLDRIESLGKYEFAFNHGDGFDFASAWADRATCQDEIELACRSNSDEWGSVYARRKSKTA